MSRLRLTLIALAVSFCSISYADAVDDLVKSKMESQHLPGVGFFVVNPQNQITYRTYGVADVRNNDPYTPKTVHRIASLSKQICAHVALNVIKEGKLGIDDPVKKYLPQVPDSWGTMTIRHLLGHVSGIAAPNGWDISKEYTLDEYIALLSEKPLETQPGEKYAYNNHGYSLLGLIAAKAMNSTLPELAKKYIFDPVGMISSGYYEKGVVPERMSHAFYWENEKWVLGEKDRPFVYHGSGGVYSTLEDMAKYEMALRFGILDRNILEQQWTKSFPNLGKYGYGWNVEDDRLYHTGTTYGYTSAFIREKNSGWTILMFRNSTGESQLDMADEILQLWKKEFSGN
ncbi:MAG: serine hydrolase domain-containing protein [Fimbriimonadaceae bacterium]